MKPGQAWHKNKSHLVHGMTFKTGNNLRKHHQYLCICLIGAARLLRIPSIAPMAAIQIVFGKFYKTILTFVVITVISVKNDTSVKEAATQPWTGYHIRLDIGHIILSQTVNYVYAT